MMGIFSKRYWVFFFGACFKACLLTQLWRRSPTDTLLSLIFSLTPPMTPRRPPLDGFLFTLQTSMLFVLINDSVPN